jgi:Cellulose binding domain
VAATVVATSAAVFSDHHTNPQTLKAADSWAVGTPTLKAQYRNYDSNPSDGAIRPGLQVVNTGTASVSLSSVTVRYWFTRNGGSTVGAYCDYAQRGCDTVTQRTVIVDPVKTGADTYLEVGFKSGTLAAGEATGDLQLSLRKADGSSFDETDDYSYATNTSYADRTKVTVYVNDTLVWGTEPTPVKPSGPSLKAQYSNLESGDQPDAVKPGLRLVNTGTSSVSLATVTARYWFTKDGGASTFATFCDYAALDCSNVTHAVKSVSPARPGADAYLEVGFRSGTLATSDSTGDIQLRFNKTDYSPFTETDDYSYKAPAGYADATRVTVYANGVLVSGTAP